MDIKTLESQLLDENFAIDGCDFRYNRHITFSTPDDAKEFLVKFLVLETTVGVDFEDEELLSAYKKITDMLDNSNVISSSDLPYHPKKSRPSKEVKFILDDCECSYVT